MNQVKNDFQVPSWAMWLGGVVLVYLMVKKVFEYLAA